VAAAHAGMTRFQLEELPSVPAATSEAGGTSSTKWYRKTCSRPRLACWRTSSLDRITMAFVTPMLINNFPSSAFALGPRIPTVAVHHRYSKKHPYSKNAFSKKYQEVQHALRTARSQNSNVSSILQAVASRQ
jgi:hypothetical protein